MAVEQLATLFNILANVCLLRHICRTPSAPVPRTVVGLQILGNLSWMTHSARSRDYYLLVTATVSLIMQVISIAMLFRERARRRMTSSDTSLPCLPPPTRLYDRSDT